MRLRRAFAGILVTATAFGSLLGSLEVAVARPARALPGGTGLAVPPRTRLLVISPHPDDETLAAGGLIQSVLRRGGTVDVVFLTNGDGFSLAARRALKRVRPTPQDYLEFGSLRQGEAERALSVLGVRRDHVTFLGFPDRGLLRLWTDDWTRPYRSPYTYAGAVPYPTAWAPGSTYSGETLDRLLQDLLSRLQPDLVISPGLMDFHPDHKAAGLFTRHALAAARARGETWAVRARHLEYVIHRERWNLHQDRVTLATLHLPRQDADMGGTWQFAPLTPAEREQKRRAVAAYRSQTAVMARFLYAFTSGNEPFREDTDLLTDTPRSTRRAAGGT